MARSGRAHRSNTISARRVASDACVSEAISADWFCQCGRAQTQRNCFAVTSHFATLLTKSTATIFSMLRVSVFWVNISWRIFRPGKSSQESSLTLIGPASFDSVHSKTSASYSFSDKTTFSVPVRIALSDGNWNCSRLTEGGTRNVAANSKVCDGLSIRVPSCRSTSIWLSTATFVSDLSVRTSVSVSTTVPLGLVTSFLRTTLVPTWKRLQFPN